MQASKELTGGERVGERDREPARRAHGSVGHDRQRHQHRDDRCTGTRLQTERVARTEMWRAGRQVKTTIQSQEAEHDRN